MVLFFSSFPLPIILIILFNSSLFLYLIFVIAYCYYNGDDDVNRVNNLI